MTAIAAVLAFATPATAQEIAPTVVPETIIAPDPIAPVAAESALPSTVPTSDPLIPPATTEAKIAPATARPAKVSASKRASPATAQRAVVPVRVPAPTVAAADRVSTRPTEAPKPSTTPAVAAPVATTVLVADPAPLAPAEPVAATAENVVPIVAAGGLGLLALIGAGVGLRRRRKRSEDSEYPGGDLIADEAFAEPTPEPQMRREPVMATAPSEVPRDASAAPATKLPDGFDLSRFGPHVQAAYRGPSADNASLSLKHRLRRASAMDQKARLADEEVAAAPALAPALAPATERGVVARSATPGTGFMLGGAPTTTVASPVTQH